jgi:hypothetical protein
MKRLYREFQVDLASGSFVVPVASIQVNEDFWTPSALSANTTYKWRCRDVSDKGFETGWSEAQYFTTIVS